MNFECKKLNITDDPDFGCTIEFTDTIEQQTENMTIEELFNSKTKYLLIQKSYPEDEDENDWYTIETSESDIDFNQKDKMLVTLGPEKFELNYSGELIVIGLNISDKEILNLEKTLRSQFKEKVILKKI